MGHELPPEILNEIFSRLPAKAVGRCRCLAKPWRTLLSSPQFIKSHLSRRPRQETLILISPEQSINIISKMGLHNVSRKVELGKKWVEFVGSWNGLVLLLGHDEEKFLVNPTTLEQVKIPDSPVALKKDESTIMYGFGYDSCSNDYKIVTLSYNDEYEDDPDHAETYVDVYSVKKGVWRRVDYSPYDHALPEPCSGAFVNGAIHWLASRRDSPYHSVIGAFDLAREAFYELPPPSGVDVEKFVYNKLVVLGGCLCMVDVWHSNQADFWIMKEHGLANSWMKFTINVNHIYSVFKPLWFIGDDGDSDVVFITERKSLVVYNREGGTLRDMVVDGVREVDRVRALANDGGTFVESLVSPNLGLAEEMGK